MELPKVGLDHLVVAGKQLDALGEFYQALGFQVGTTNTHPWGTINKIIQFQDQFLELIALSEGFVSPSSNDVTAPFAGFLAKFLERGEGTAMFVRTSKASDELHQRWCKQDLAEPNMLHFERAAAGADGQSVRVAFSLAFARPDLADPGFALFACQHHEPKNFWSRGRQVHPNTVRRVSQTTIVSRQIDDACGFLGTTLETNPETKGTDGARRKLPLAETTVSVMTPQEAATHYLTTEPAAGIFAVHFEVAEMGALQSCLESNDIIYHEAPAGRIIVGPGTAHGTALVFEVAPVVTDS